MECTVYGLISITDLFVNVFPFLFAFPVLLNTELSVLRHLLGSSSDELVSGNAALCLAHCLELEGIASSLLGTDIVLLLLRHAAGDAKRTAVQQNAAIALGKLCRTEPRCPLNPLNKPLMTLITFKKVVRRSNDRIEEMRYIFLLYIYIYMNVITTNKTNSVETS